MKISRAFAIFSSVAILSLGFMACSNGGDDSSLPVVPNMPGTTTSGTNPGSANPGSTTPGTNPGTANPGSTTPGTNPNPETPVNPVDNSGKINSALWGTWVRMDTGSTIRITDTSVMDATATPTYYPNPYSQYKIQDFALESSNVLVWNGLPSKPRLFRESGYSKKFTAKIAGLEETVATRGPEGSKKIDKAIKDKKVKRQNKENKSDAEEVTSSADGTVEFKDAVAGETQQISIETANGEITLDLVPHFDGEDMGVIPVIEDGKCSFKVTYRTTNSYNYDYSMGMPGMDNNFYLYSGNSYKIYLDINNFGNEEMKDGYYEITCDDSNLSITGNKKALLNTVEANSKKTIELDVKYGTIYDEYVDVPVNISITDYATKREWLDKVTLRFYRRPVYISVNAYSTLKTGSLHGFVIAPDGRSMYFNVNHGNETKITVPWAKGDSNYMLVINGADANNEMFYAFKVSDNQIGSNSMSSMIPTNQIYDWDAFIKQEDVEEQIELKYSFESSSGNNTEKYAHNAGNGFKVIRSYIEKADIDYYKLNINETTATISVVVQPLSDIKVTSRENGNEVTFTAEKGYATYYWELNGNEVQKSEKYTYKFNKAELNSGVYELYMRAEKTEEIPNPDFESGVQTVTDYRSATIMFRVEK